MGCDIHFYVERYTTEPDMSNGPKDITEYREARVNSIIDSTEVQPRWISQDDWEQGEYEGGKPYWRIDKELYSGRNYWLFNLLADVRYGPDWLKPLDSPRGVPADASYAYRQVVKDWDCDGHSHSYFTLTELLEVPDDMWDKIECSEFRRVMADMQVMDSNTDNVRCVFFFDN